MRRLALQTGIVLVCLAIQTSEAFAENVQRQLAITIDDLPYADGPCDLQQTLANTKKLLAPIRAGRVPVVGFVIGKRCQNLTAEQRRSILRLWLTAGGELGNHTWSHPDLNRTSLESYEADVLHADTELHGLLGPVVLRYFRAPYLHDGENLEIKARLQSFLERHGYHEAPVTLDNNDWTFAAAYSRALKAHDAEQAKAIEDAYLSYMQSIVEFFERRSAQVFGRECPQVLLLHASRLNAQMLSALLQMYSDRGYRFITLKEAMSDGAYQTSDVYTGQKGLSWIHRWGLAKGKPMELEPDEPSWITKLANR